MMSKGSRIALVLLFVWAACSEKSGRQSGESGADASADAAQLQRGELTFGAACTDSQACAQGLCLQVNGVERRCTKPCAERLDCPAASNWACGLPKETTQRLCLCIAEGPEVCLDGKDNDCNGKVDDCLTCGGRSIAPNNRFHCGACDVQCPSQTECRGGECRCADGQPASACTDAQTPQCRNDAECNDGNKCTNDVCVQGRCSLRLASAPCPSGENCSLTSGVCVPGKACATDSDCADAWACSMSERCDLTLKRCLWRTLDGDFDGDPPASCGGNDCDDTDPVRSSLRMESCDGIDNNCDGKVDAPLSADVCEAGRSCIAQRCACDAPSVECGIACVDLKSDVNNCGACSTRCATGQTCTDGVCTCTGNQRLCSSGCRDDAWFTSNASHCGTCNTACTIAGQACVNGSCACTADGAALCSGACVDTKSSRAHCGGCGQTCSAICASGCVAPKELIAGYSRACAIMANDELYCWGIMPGDGTSGAPTAVRVEAIAGAPFTGTKYLSQSLHACALRDDTGVYCWGDNDSGQVGNSAVSGSVGRPVPVRLVSGSSLSGITAISSKGAGAFGSTHSCAVSSSGHVYCWGSNLVGQLGDGTLGSVRPFAAPVELSPGVLLGDVRSVYVEATLSCALLTNGDVYCWGSNSFGRLGSVPQGGASYSARPVRVETSAGVPLTNVETLALSDGHACALKQGSGEAWCWGKNDYGQLGIGTRTATSYATQVQTASGIALTGLDQIELGSALSCARTVGKQVHCWGSRGQYPTVPWADLVYEAGPVALGGVEQVVVGPAHACGRLSDGSVRCWGSSGISIFGDDTSGDHLLAVTVLGLRDAKALAGYRDAMCALTPTTVQCWGRNDSGLLTGTTDHGTPRAINWP